MTQEQSHPGRSRKLLIISSLALLVFLFIFVNVISNGPLLDVDRWISEHVPVLHSDVLTRVIIFITNIGGVMSAIIFSFFMTVYLYVKKDYATLKFYLVSVVGSVTIFTFIKFLVQRARPEARIIAEHGYSFPSGHSTMSMVIALSLYFIFVSKISSSLGRRGLLVLALFWPILIAFSRIYLNVHWFSDTLAGFLLGLFWVTSMVFLFPQATSQK